MDSSKIISTTEQFVKKQLAGENTGHDWWHAARVRRNALAIATHEGGNTLIIELAALLHDVGDRKVIGADKDNPAIARDFLQQLRLQDSTITSIMHIIENISYSKSLGSTLVSHPLELLIVQDADRLDALGAIGIARCFAFGGSRGREIYNPDILPQDFDSPDAYKNSQGTSLNHFDEKLFKLKQTFNTTAAKKLAEERDTYMHEFYDRFLAEWQGGEI